MVALLTAGVVVVGIVCLLNLALTIGVMRRLREHAALLADQSSRVGSMGGPIAGRGDAVDDFAATTTEGELVTRELLTGPTLVGFFSPSCAPCAETVPKFAAHAEKFPGGRGQVLAVVIGDPTEASKQVAALTAAARVVIEPLDGPIARAFGVRGYPALAVVDANHTILASGVTLDHVAGAAVAAVAA